MPRLGGRHTIKPLSVQEQLELNVPETLNPRQRKNLRDEQRRARRVAVEEDRFRRRHFKDRTSLCPICLDTCNGFMSKNRKAALCLRLQSDSPDPYQTGWWHALGWRRGKRVCGCGVLHEAEPA